MSAIDSSSILQGSGWLAHRYDPVLDSFHFVEVPRAAQSGATFLTDEFLPDTPPLHVATRAQVIAATPHTAPIHYIFHSAFCCSTLLARALDRPGLAIALKEPVVLNDLVGWRRRGGKDGDVAAVLDSALTLLARPFGADEAVVIKPSNIVAGISNAMLAMRPDSRAVLMYTPLRAYLGSIAKKGLWGRLWVRDLFVGLLQDRLIDLGIAAADHIKLTDLQIAAVGWLAQHALFARMLARHGGTRVRSLDSETMLASPEEALRAVFALFGWGDRLDLVSRIIAEGAFARHSKDAVPFAAENRRDAQIAAADAHADEIEKVTVWAETVAQRVGIAFTLAHPLI